MKLKKVAVTAAIRLTGMALMACDGKKSEESSAAAGNEGSVSSGNITTDAAKVKTVSADKLTVVTNTEFPPYECHEGNDIKGIDVEICQIIVKKLRLKLETEDVAFDAIILEVAPGKTDLAAAGIAVTEDRRQNMDFPDTYASARQLILVKDDSTLAGKDDLKGKEIGVQQGTASDLMNAEDFGDGAVVCFSKSMEAVQTFTQGKIDMVIVSSQTAEQSVKEVPGIKALDANYSDESYAIGVKEGNTKLLNAANGALSGLKSEGKLDEIVAQYTRAE